MATILKSTPPDIENFKQKLKEHQLKATPQRLAVHKAMMDLGHASADMVAEHITGKGETRITVASVYNILTQLSDLGIYDRRLSANNKMYFDINTFRHIHLYDTERHDFKDIMDEELIALVDAHLKRCRFRGYRIDGIDIQINCHPSTLPRKA